MNPAPLEFATARLDARQVGAEDLEFLDVTFHDDRVTDTLGGERDRERLRADIARWLAHWETHGFGVWILRDRATENLVGWTMLQCTDTGGPGSVEVGWTIAAGWWGDGLATEAGAAAVRIGFTDVGLEEIVSFTLVDNMASRRVMEKLGMRYEHEVENVGLPHVLYRLDRHTWEQQQDG